MPSLADLIRLRDGLFEARLRGVREVQDQNGERIRYGSDREMANALAAADRAILDMQSGQAARTILFRTSKGL